MRNVWIWLLTAALMLSLAACGENAGETSLWVVTEQTTWDRMNGQTVVLIQQFEKEHPGVKVNLDILPTGEQERAAYLQNLRTQIVKGGGPDAYLLPTDERLIIGDGGYSYPTVEPLFADVNQAMLNGMFRDISGLYDADTALGKESLHTRVMDAGKVENARYVLPLRYDIPVIYADTQALEAAGVSADILQKPLDQLMAALSSDDAKLAAGGIYRGDSLFAAGMDYTAGTVALTEETLEAYLHAYQQLRAQTGEHGSARVTDLRSYIWGYYDTENRYAVRFPLYIGGLADLLSYCPVAQYEQSQLAILPMQSVGGGTVAQVTYYAAVGSGCSKPELAYEFLRLFLLEDSQWEKNRPEKMNVLLGMFPNKTLQDSSNKTQYPGLIESGWPVRTEGALDPLWDVRRRQIYSPTIVGDVKTRLRKICLSPLEERWTEIFDTPIDQVRFPTTVDALLADALATLNDPLGAYRPTDVDVQALAQRLLWDMRRHVSEG